MKNGFETMCWPAQRLGEALQTLARSAGLPAKSVEELRPPAQLIEHGEERLSAWIEVAARSVGLEAKSVDTSYKETQSLIRNCAPALLRLEFNGEPAFLAILRSRRASITVLTPDLTLRSIRPDLVRNVLCEPLEAPLAPEIDRLLDDAGITGRHRDSAAASILGERLVAISVQGCWLLRIPSSASLRRQMHESGLLLRLCGFVALHTADVLLLMGAWWMIGRAVLEGRLDYGWLMAWALLLITRIPFQLSAVWLQGVIAFGAGAIFKRRLLAGSLRFQPEEIRHQGVGQLLGRVIESEALESLALGGGITGLVALIELILATAILAGGAQNVALSLLLPAWTSVIGLLTWRYIHQRQHWTDVRLDITNDLIERMAGHRTRLAQEDPDRWHDAEDESLERYMTHCIRMDRGLIRLMAIAPRGWLILSVLTLIPSFFSATATAPQLATIFGAVLLATGALKKMSGSFAHLGGALIAWKQVKTLFDAAARKESEGTPEFALRPASHESADTRETLLEARDLVFAHQGRADKVLDKCNLRIVRGDRILLEGRSGGGKSTLASLLTGLRQPLSGLLMLRGLDWQTLGSRAWRRKITAAPQFHENHIFTGTLAFNLLMGRRWPPKPEDLEEAEAVCRELGLGNLLDRMPAGLNQQVGETGWQLSYGERSRVFLARAILQGGDMVILDESFGALDPETLRQSMECVRTRTNTLLVIAHP